MRYSHIVLILAFLLAAAACGRNEVELQPWKAYRNPVVLDNVPGPDILREGDRWYLYAAGSLVDVLQVKSSADLVKWDTEDPAFTAETMPSFIPGGTMGAPSVVKASGRYLMYYSLWLNASQCGIGVAEAASPKGPWTDRGAVFTAASLGLQGLSDPCAVSDDGALYLAFCASAGLYLLRLDGDGLQPADGQSPLRIGDATLKAPAFMRKDGTWYLFATVGNQLAGASSNSTLSYCTAEALTGPYGTPSVLVGRAPKFAGPGSAACPVQDADGTDWLVYNAYYLSSVSAGRTVVMDRLDWSSGSPVVRGGVTSFIADAPLVSQ